ncbi:MAG: circularly permuted type 2 ATP-grasp protein, partial [Burkholderiaceae bacterium]
DVTYHPPGTDGAGRPWQFDLLPFVMNQADFDILTEGLSQRARLLEAIIADLLGPQSLVRDGLLPAAIAFGNNSFLPACHGTKPPGSKYLYLAGFDVARAPDGHWWVVRNRISRPSGLGYALEARLIASRCLPDIFDQAKVERIAQFFRTFGDSLKRLAGQENPLSLILTPHQRGNDYFDHAFLGRYLGHSVVTSGDLTVRDNRVYLKTIRGLRPVDLLVRRIDTADCDPLVLNFDSNDGVPGLMHAVRHGKVPMANWPGCEIADDPSLDSFLPRLCQHLLGEDLLLPSVASWWCGQPAERDFVLDNLERLVIRRLETINRPTPGREQYVGAQLSLAERDKLKQEIQAFPDEFVALERMKVSVTPAWKKSGQIVAAETTIRLYLSAAESGFYLMPGGLARADTSDQPEGSGRLPNEINKDIWVSSLTDRPAEPTVSSLIRQQPDLERSDRHLASRTADNLFWLGAYLERAEGATRLLRSLIQQVTGESTYSNQSTGLERLAAVLVSQGQLTTRHARRLLTGSRRTFALEISNIIFDHEGSDGVQRIVGNIARTADRIRERLSPDMWRLLERLEHLTHDKSENQFDMMATQGRLNSLLDTMAAINGSISMNMTRADGWRFLSLGRRIERVQQTARLFNELTARPEEFEHGPLNLLLEVSDSAITYRTRYGATPQFVPVADLILADDTNPRSILTQVIGIADLTKALPEIDQHILHSPSERTLTRLGSNLQLLDIKQLDTSRSRTGNRTLVTRLCRQTQVDMNFIAERLTIKYFSHAEGTRTSGQLSGL